MSYESILDKFHFLKFSATFSFNNTAAEKAERFIRKVKLDDKESERSGDDIITPDISSNE